jgi:hypothetical protein
MGFGNSIVQAIEIIKLNVDTIKKVSKDDDANWMGIFFISVGVFLYGLGSKRFESSLFWSIVSVILSLFWMVIIHGLALLFGGTAKCIELFRVLSYFSILGWLGILFLIPPIEKLFIIFISYTILFYIFVSFLTLRNVYSLTKKKALIIVIITITLESIIISGFIFFIWSMMMWGLRY